MRIQVRKVIYQDTDLQPGDLISIKEASRILGMTLPGISRAIERGVFTEYIDADAPKEVERNRRFLDRKEVEALRDMRQKLGTKQGRKKIEQE